jgi:adenylate cyclase class 2
MTYEVELKFPLPDEARLRAQLAELNTIPGDPRAQCDRYLRHPARDFAQTHEAFRIRDTDGELCLTYKGPVIDPLVKTRREIEIPIGSGAHDVIEVIAMFTALGFSEVRRVDKRRFPFAVQWEGRSLEVVIDVVADLGTFAEIEGLAEESEREAVRDSILRLADRFGLKQPERRSYLKMLLERDGV